MLEHIEDDVKALQNILHVLLPGGTLVLQVSEIVGEGKLTDEAIAFGHVRSGYTEQEILEKLRLTGFNVRSVGHCYSVVASVARSFSRRLAKIKSPCPLDVLAFPFLRTLVHVDSLITRTPRKGGLVVVANRINSC